MKVIETNTYHRPELTAYVQEQLKDLEQHSLIDAEDHGNRNKPLLLENNVKPYLVGNHHKAQAIMSHVASVLQPAALISEVVESEKATERRIQASRNMLVIVKQKAVEFEKELKGKHPEHSPLRVLLVWIAVCIPLLGDGMLNRPVFETFGYNFIESVCMSLLLAASLAVLAHSFGKIVALGKTIRQRRAIVAVISLLVTVLFYYLADTRASYLTHEAATYTGNGKDIDFSPIPFTMMSVLLFGIAVAINFFFFPSREQRKATRDYYALKYEYALNTAEHLRIEQGIEALQQQHEELVQVNGSIYVYGSKLEDMIISHAQIAFAAWEKVNMMHRPDNGRPICFGSDEYPFTFQRNFKPINLN
jgi:hypothetical protein